MTSQVPVAETLLEALIAAFDRAARYNRSAMVAPAAILWPDEPRQWEPILPLLREHLPALLTLGKYAPDQRTGPAIWMRCLLAGELEAADWPEDAVPVLYLPGVSRQMLHASESCSRQLKPLVELQYRGVLWSRPNGRDWSVRAFLRSKDDLGLDVAKDQATAKALERAFPVLATTPAASLRGRRLEAANFDQLLSPDPQRDLLRWLADPAATRGRWTDERWDAFRSICRETYGFDPETDGELVAVQRMTEQKGPWQQIWIRFAETPKSYNPGIPRLLERVQPRTLAFDTSCWPSINAKEEVELRAVLGELPELAPRKAGKRIVELEKHHGTRRGWVWASLGQATLATALEHLAILAETTASPLAGATPEAMAEAYAESGWRADGAALRALAAVRTGEDAAAVKAALQAVYRPWLEDTARRLQELLRDSEYPGSLSSGAGGVEAAPGEALLFADGLRYDVGRLLHQALEGRGLVAELATRWSALPTVTPTSKPAVSPVNRRIEGKDYNEDFRPHVAADGKPLTTHRFRQLLAEAGYQVLTADVLGDPAGKGWLEHGDLDRSGHQQGWKLARQIHDQVRELAELVEALLDAGWQSVRVITDHGWLLLPGGLPKTELPKYLADTRWGRCAVLKKTATVEVQVVDWHWSNAVRIAVAPGISCFKAGIEYAHGGLSLQECLTPTLRVRRGAQELRVTVDDVSWRGLRCRVRLAGAHQGLRADVRRKPAAAETSIAATGKEVDPSGYASLVVPDDDDLGHAAFVVAVAADGQVLAKRATTVGGGD